MLDNDMEPLRNKVLFSYFRHQIKLQWSQAASMIRMVMSLSGHDNDPREDQIRLFGRYVKARFYQDYVSGNNHKYDLN